RRPTRERRRRRGRSGAAGSRRQLSGGPTRGVLVVEVVEVAGQAVTLPEDERSDGEGAVHEPGGEEPGRGAVVDAERADEERLPEDDGSGAADGEPDQDEDRGAVQEPPEQRIGDGRVERRVRAGPDVVEPSEPDLPEEDELQRQQDGRGGARRPVAPDA